MHSKWGGDWKRSSSLDSDLFLFAVDELGVMVLFARSPACGCKVPGRRVLDYYRCKDIDIAEAGDSCSMACSLALNASFESFGLRVEGMNKRTNDV